MSTFVYNINALLNTDDGNANSNLNFRVVIAPSLLTAALGNQAKLHFLFGTASPTEVGSVTSCYFGQSGGGATFKGDQVQVTFGGQPSFNASASGPVVSDWVVLPQNWDAKKSYTCAFHFKNGSAAHCTVAAVAGMQAWGDSGGADSSSQTSPSGLTDQAADAFLLEAIEVQFVSNISLGSNQSLIVV